ncbi:MAG: ABC transporter permease [Acidobacteriota bacterium]|nr:ABC transporter permease [Acidobacteriota bacterium]
MHDLRLAFRNLIRRPAFSVIAILTLALGIGANAAVFTVSNAVLLSPLPYERPEDVVILNEQTPQFPTASVTRFNYDDWRARAKSFTGIAAFRPTNMTVTGTGDPERVPVRMITASLVPLLGVQVSRGRAFIDADDKPAAEAVTILGAGFAGRVFPGQDPVGQMLTLDNRPYTVVGVMSATFELFQPADIYVPFGPWAATLPDDRGWHPGILPIARLKPGVTIEQARTEMNGIAQQLETEYPESNKDVRVLVTRIQDQLVQNIRPALVLLTGAVALVLLIACANVANLLLARAVDRQKEIALRIALGASRSRVIRQLVVESVVLACVGGAAGLIVASWAVSLLTSASVGGVPRMQNIAVEWPVVLFAMGLSVLTGVMFGLVPAVQVTQQPIRDALNEESRGGSGSVRQRKIRSALVVVEVGLALVLLIGAGLLLRSFSSLVRVAPGFDPANLLVVNLPLSPLKYRDSAVRTGTVDRIIEKVRATPGVQSAAMTTTLPMAGAGATIHFNRAAYPPKGPDDYVMAGYRAVTADYLTTLGVKLRAGRLLSTWDRQGGELVAVINESMARQYFSDRDPIGERFQLGTEPDPDFPTMEIVGVVADMKQSFEAGAKAEFFVPYAQHPDPIIVNMYLNTALVVRTSGNPAELTSTVRSIVREIDPTQPLVNVRTMEAALANTVAQPRFQMTLLLTFAGLALVLAAIGVYGVMAYTVSQRVPEIGVRMAVGASPVQVVRMVVWQGAKLTAFGVILGLAAAMFGAVGMQSLLFEVRALDPLTFGIAPIVLTLAALFASYIPARRAARISPLAALGR